MSLAWQCMSTLAGDSDKAVSGCEHALIYDHPALNLMPLLLQSVAGKKKKSIQPLLFTHSQCWNKI